MNIKNMMIALSVSILTAASAVKAVESDFDDKKIISKTCQYIGGQTPDAMTDQDAIQKLTKVVKDKNTPEKNKLLAGISLAYMAYQKRPGAIPRDQAVLYFEAALGSSLIKQEMKDAITNVLTDMLYPDCLKETVKSSESHSSLFCIFYTGRVDDSQNEKRKKIESYLLQVHDSIYLSQLDRDIAGLRLGKMYNRKLTIETTKRTAALYLQYASRKNALTQLSDPVLQKRAHRAGDMAALELSILYDNEGSIEGVDVLAEGSILTSILQALESEYLSVEERKSAFKTGLQIVEKTTAKITNEQRLSFLLKASKSTSLDQADICMATNGLTTMYMKDVGKDIILKNFGGNKTELDCNG